jgi:hypothetical protein
MANPDQLIEARLFVRHSDGNSFVVPDYHEDHGRQRLSFSIDVPADVSGAERFEAIKKVLGEDEEMHLNDFMPQQYIGSYAFVLLAGNHQKSQNERAHGYLAQIWPGRDTSRETGRRAIPFSDVEQLINHDASIDRVDRNLASRALRTVHRQAHPRQS